MDPKLEAKVMQPDDHEQDLPAREAVLGRPLGSGLRKLASLAESRYRPTNPTYAPQPRTGSEGVGHHTTCPAISAAPDNFGHRSMPNRPAQVPLSAAGSAAGSASRQRATAFGWADPSRWPSIAPPTGLSTGAWHASRPLHSRELHLPHGSDTTFGLAAGPSPIMTVPPPVTLGATPRHLSIPHLHPTYPSGSSATGVRLAVLPHGNSYRPPHCEATAASRLSMPANHRALSSESSKGHSQLAPSGSSTRSRGMEGRLTGPSAGPSRREIASSPSPVARPGSAERKIRIGIETEFLLEAKDKRCPPPNIDDFVEILAKRHNQEVRRPHFKMNPKFLDPTDSNSYQNFSMVYDVSCRTPREPWGLEMVSPILEVFPGSPWREHVVETWNYLQRHYNITESDACSTQVHISLETGYSVNELKAIASAVIHFETAFEALVPPHRRGNRWSRSNWLGSPNLARKGRDRAESIAEINRAESKDEVISLMQIPQDKNFCWNFWSLFSSKGTIEFRKPPASVEPADALSWAELVITFIQASVSQGSIALYFPPTLGGLRLFLKQVGVPGTNESHRLRSLWAGTRPEAALQPRYISPQDEDREKEDSETGARARLEALTAEDQKCIDGRAAIFQIQYSRLF